jgi:hypothetical protein
VAAAFAAYCGFGFGFSVALVHLVRPLESISNGMYFIKFNFISYNAAHCAALCLCLRVRIEYTDTVTGDCDWHVVTLPLCLPLCSTLLYIVCWPACTPASDFSSSPSPAARVSMSISMRAPQ